MVFQYFIRQSIAGFLLAGAQVFNARLLTYNEPGQNDDAYSLQSPYYFNLAPDRDLLVALTYMSSRRFIYEGKYRQLIAPKISADHEDSIYSIEAKYLPEDKITGLKRWLVNFSEELDLSDKIHLSAQYHGYLMLNILKKLLEQIQMSKRLSHH